MNKAGFKEITIEKVVKTSLLVSISDVLINLFVTLMTGSFIMLSQTLQGTSDLVAALFLVLGTKFSKRQPDRKHAFGYGREIYFWTFISALVTLSFTSVASFFFGFKRFINPEIVNNIHLAYTALLIAIVTNGYSMSLSLRRLLGKHSISNIYIIFSESAFIATKKAFILDLMGTIASIFGLSALILYTTTGVLRFDGLGSMIIGITTGFLAIFILKGSKDLLIGQSASPETENSIRQATLSFPEVRKILDLKTLYLGNKKLLVNMEVHLANNLDTDDIEKLIDKIEKEIKQRVPEAGSIHIELETPDIK
jgi:cation diffusion facilitator family transporter